ncbi:MAG: hypothetical protein V1866_03130 [archaeon]
MPSKLHNKRGQATTFSIEYFVKIVFTIMVAVMFFLIGFKIYSMFFAYDKDAMNNFNALADSMEIMLQRPDQFDYSRMVIQIKEPYNIFGFNGAFDGSTSDTCDGYPCICIMKDAKSAKCRIFKPEKGKVFMGRTVTMLTGHLSDPQDNFLNEKFPNQKQVPACYGSDFQMTYRPLSLYYFTDDKSEFEEIYLEKVACGQDNFIMLGERLSLGTINSRIAHLSMCPEGSDDACKISRRDTQAGGVFCYYDDSQKKCISTEAKHCEFGKEITEKCICGSKDAKELVDPANRKVTLLYKQFKYEGKLYCTKRASDSLEVVTPFSCDNICECKHYCYFSSKDAECNELEAQYCNTMDLCAVLGSCVLEDNRCEVQGQDQLTAEQVAMVRKGCEGKTPISN